MKPSFCWPTIRFGILISALVALTCLTGGAYANSACSPPMVGVQGYPPVQFVYQECVAGAPLVHVVAVADRQHQSEWCWAASTSMIFRYYRHAVAQERIVDEAYGGLINMPAQPATLSAGLERSWTDDDGHEFHVTAQIFDVQDQIANANISDLIAALSDKHPVIIGAAGHAMVLTAIKYIRYANGQIGPITFARVLDPATGTSRPLDPMHSFVTYMAIVDVSDD